jgi:ABC-type transport system substrate-binding protein
VGSVRRDADARGRGVVTTRLALLVLCLVSSLVVFACGRLFGETSPTGSAAPHRGGSLTFVTGYEPRTLDPVTSWDLNTLVNIFNTLYEYEGKPGVEGLKLVPALAASMPRVSADGRTYLIRLRRGVRFAPPVNREVTADDVQYSFERLLRHPESWCTFFYNNVDGVREFIAGKGDHLRGLRVVDPYTVEFRLIDPDPAFINTLAMWFCGVVPREWVAKWGREFARHPLGSGPYMLDEWKPGTWIILKRNPNYSGAAPAWLDEVRLSLSYQNAERDLMRLLRGEVDFVLLSRETYLQAKSMPGLAKYVFWDSFVGCDVVLMNAQMRPFDDVRVRRAVCWAIDRERIARLTGGSPLWQIYPRGMPGHDPDVKHYGYDPAKARSLLAEAGYPDGLETTLFTPGGQDTKLAQAVQNDLRAAGIRAEIRMIPSETYWTVLSTPHTAPMAMRYWVMDYPDPYDWIMPFFTKAAAVKDGSNHSFWWDPKLEAMLVDAQRTFDPAARIAKYREMEVFISDQAPAVPMANGVIGGLVSARVGGFFFHQVYPVLYGYYWRQ